MASLYEIFELNQDCTADELKSSYRRLAQKYHPDKNPQNKEAATKKFQIISQAYHILSDPEKRQEYDASLGNFEVLTMTPEKEEEFQAWLANELRRIRAAQSVRDVKVTDVKVTYTKPYSYPTRVIVDIQGYLIKLWLSCTIIQLVTGLTPYYLSTIIAFPLIIILGTIATILERNNPG